MFYTKVSQRFKEMTISTNQKPTIYRNLYENTGPGSCLLSCMITTRFYRFYRLQCNWSKSVTEDGCTSREKRKNSPHRLRRIRLAELLNDSEETLF